MIKNFYLKHQMEKYISLEKLEKFDVLNISKGTEIYLSDLYFLIKGNIEIFVNYSNKKMKLKNADKEHILIGFFNYLNHPTVSIIYKAKTDIILLKIPKKNSDYIHKNFNIIKEYNKFLIKNLMEINEFLLIKTTTSSENFLKYILKKEMDKNNYVYIENLIEFLENYKISKSNFYTNIKKLEKAKELKKVDKGYLIYD